MQLVPSPCCWKAGRCRAVLLLAAAFLLLLPGCSVGRKVRTAFGGKLPVEVTVLDSINDDSPVAVDLVIVYDDKLVDELLKMSSTEWFAKKEQFKKDHPGIDVQGWEWVPGQIVPPLNLDYHAGARNVVLFADYHTEGEHRAVVGKPKPFSLLLGERDLSLPSEANR
jgi:type VI secretion system protein